MARILVTDGETRTCLAATRALGRAGHHVFVAAARLPALATVSRYCIGAQRVPSFREEPDNAAEALAGLVARWKVDLVLPATDASCVALLPRYGHRIGSAVVAAADPGAFEALSNKAELLPRAEAVGLRVPRSVVARRPEQLERAAREVGFPCVLKPHQSVVKTPTRAFTFGVRHAMSDRDLDLPFPEEAFPVVVQEYIPGAGEGMFLLADRGRLLAAFAHRRLREKPPEGGVSVYRESIPLDPELLDKSLRLLNSVNWRGAAMVECRRPPGEGAVVMEVNGRLWGSLQLALDAGVDFPNLMVDLFLDRPVAPVLSYRIGVRTRWIWGDIDHLLARFKGLWRPVPAQRGLPSFPRTLWSFVWQFTRPGDHYEVLSWADPRPFMRETLDWFRGRAS